MGDNDTSSASGPAAGLLASLRRLIATFVEILRTRGELLSTELEEEVVRIRELVLYGLVSLFFLGFGLLLLTLFIIVIFWESAGPTVLGGFAFVYLAMGVVMALMIRHKLKTRPPLFSATLAELGKDRERLTARS